MRLVAGVLVLLVTGIGHAAEDGGDGPKALEIGVRRAAMFGPGDPTNDMLGGGAFIRMRTAPGWGLGLGLDQLNYDVETPIDAVGLRAPESDADGTSNAVSAWVERHGTLSRQWEWFAAAGASYVSVDVGDLPGTTNDGSPYLLTNDISSEYTVFADFGLRVEAFSRLRLEAGARIEQRFGDWKFQETVSGREGTLDDYATMGLWLGFSYRFR